MSKSILCAVDISNRGDDQDVLNTAAKLASLDSLQLDLITVVPDFGMSVVGSFFSEDHHDKMVGEAKEKLNDLVESTLGAETNAGVRHIVATGKVYEEVLNAAKATGASLIVVGAHKTDLKDYLLGPNASRVARHADVSVYIVRQ